MRTIILTMIVLLMTAGCIGTQNTESKIKLADPPSENVQDVINLIEKQREYDSIYEVFIGYLKKHEGYRGNPYSCSAGAKTVGYGHVIKEEDDFNYPLDKSSADSLLRADFNKRIEWIEEDLGLNKIKEPHKVLALAHFIFNVGQGNFKNSSLYKDLMKTGKLTKKITRFVHIKTNDGYMESSHLKKMRNFEYKMFNKSV